MGRRSKNIGVSGSKRLKVLLKIIQQAFIQVATRLVLKEVQNMLTRRAMSRLGSFTCYVNCDKNYTLLYELIWEMFFSIVDKLLKDSLGTLNV